MKQKPLSPCGLAIVSLSLLFACGCGTNKFQQELETEEAALKLYQETTAGEYELISTEQVKQLVDSDSSFVLVDAMPFEASFKKGHIAGAVNFDFPKEVMDDWDREQMNDRTLDDYAAILGEDKNATIVVYCGYVKCARSHNAAIFARQLGYTNVKRYPGGIHAWRGAGYPLTTD